MQILLKLDHVHRKHAEISETRNNTFQIILCMDRVCARIQMRYREYLWILSSHWSLVHFKKKNNLVHLHLSFIAPRQEYYFTEFFLLIKNLEIKWFSQIFFLSCLCSWFTFFIYGSLQSILSKLNVPKLDSLVDNENKM